MHQNDIRVPNSSGLVSHDIVSVPPLTLPTLTAQHAFHTSVSVLVLFLKLPRANATHVWSLLVAVVTLVLPSSAPTGRCVVSLETDFILPSVLVIDLWFPHGKV